MKGIIKSSQSITGKDYSKISEQDEITDKDKSLGKEISRLSFLIGSKATGTKDTEDMLNFNSALSLLSQAQQLVGRDNRDARKLYNLARRLSR